MESPPVQGRCAICDGEERLARHHLVPRTRPHNKRDLDRATEKQLERELNPVEKLRTHPR